MTIELPEPARFYYADDDHRAVRKPLPLYTLDQMLAFRDAALEDAALMLAEQHTWITAVAAANLVHALKGTT